jgi:hypothetical protein
VIIGAVGVALIFDIVNGLHDAVNSVATVVSTRVLSPAVAVLWAGFFNFVAMFVFAPRVANTISKIVKIDSRDTAYVCVVLCGLVGAIVGVGATTKASAIKWGTPPHGLGLDSHHSRICPDRRRLLCSPPLFRDLVLRLSGITFLQSRGGGLQAASYIG